MSFSNHTLILKNDGTLWGCGDNQYGQLGLKDESTSNIATLTQITTNVSDTKLIHCGGYHSFILKNDSTLWGCGHNQYGQLGLEDATNKSFFTIIGINTNDIKSIQCGYHYTIILKNDGTLWTCGYNEHGQLGVGDTSYRTTFTQIANDVKSAHCGGNHTIILKNDGTLWGCGYNVHGQLGLGDTSRRTTLTQITTNTDNIKSVYCGGFYTFILKNDGTLWGCGNNQCYQLGLGDADRRTTFTQITNNTDDVKSVYCGGYHTLMLKNDDTIWGCGYNWQGQLGLGDQNGRTTFTQITTNTDNIKSVYCGDHYTLILKNDSTLWACGRNHCGQLGLGDFNDNTNRSTFTQVTVNTNNIKCFANEDLGITNTTKVYDSKIGYTETLDTNNFRNIPINSIETLKVLYSKPLNTILNCVISFDKKQTWKTFNGTNWIEISDTTPENMIVNCMEIEMLNSLDKKKLISGGFTGDLDFKIVMKTNNVNKTPLVTKIYIVYR